MTEPKSHPALKGLKPGDTAPAGVPPGPYVIDGVPVVVTASRKILRD